MIGYHSVIFSVLLAFAVHAAHEDADFAEAVVAGDVQKALNFANLIDINKEMPSLRRVGIIESYYNDLGASEHPLPLAFVAYVGNREILNKMLLDKRFKLEVNTANGSGVTALHAAIFNNKEDIVYLLLQHGADPNAKITKKTLNLTGVGDLYTVTYETARELAQRKGNQAIIGYLNNPPERVVIKEPASETAPQRLEDSLLSFFTALNAIPRYLQ